MPYVSYGCSHVKKTRGRKSTSLVLKRVLRGGTPDASLHYRGKQDDDDLLKGATIPSIFTLVTFKVEGCKCRILIYKLSGFKICIYIPQLSTPSCSTAATISSHKGPLDECIQHEIASQLLNDWVSLSFVVQHISFLVIYQNYNGLWRKISCPRRFDQGVLVMMTPHFIPAEQNVFSR